MKIHEYQGKAILREFGVPVPNGDVADTPAQAKAIAAKLGGKVVVKAQVHAGGRGKAGGVKLADDPAAAEAAAKQILGMMLKTPQTPPEGVKVLKVLVEEASPIAAELYLSMTLDRGRGTHVVMASQAGGMEIEEVAVTHPEKIVREWTDPALGSRAAGGVRGRNPSGVADWRDSGGSAVGRHDSVPAQPRRARGHRAGGFDVGQAGSEYRHFCAGPAELGSRRGSSVPGAAGWGGFGVDSGAHSGHPGHHRSKIVALGLDLIFFLVR